MTSESPLVAAQTASYRISTQDLENYQNYVNVWGEAMLQALTDFDKQEMYGQSPLVHQARNIDEYVTRLTYYSKTDTDLAHAIFEISDGFGQRMGYPGTDIGKIEIHAQCEGQSPCVTINRLGRIQSESQLARLATGLLYHLVYKGKPSG